jgi:hypothetical protein
MVRRSPGFTADTGWMLRTMTTRTRRADRYITTCAVVAASGFKKVTDFGCLSLQSIGLVPGDEYQLVLPDSVGYGEE